MNLLIESVLPYMKHQPWCDKEQWYSLKKRSEASCTCGRDVIVAGVKREIKKGVQDGKGDA